VRAALGAVTTRKPIMCAIGDRLTNASRERLDRKFCVPNSKEPLAFSIRVRSGILTQDWVQIARILG